MKHLNIIKLWQGQSKAFKVMSIIAFAFLLFWSLRGIVFAEELEGSGQLARESDELVLEKEFIAEAEPAVEEEGLTETEEPAETEAVVEAEVVAEEVLPEEESTGLQPKGLTDLIPDGVVFDPEGESFVTIDGEVVKEGEYYYEFLLESITADTVLFSSNDEEYEIPVHSISRLESIIDKFDDIYVEGILYDAKGKSYVVINDVVAREGDTIGGFLVESIGDSKVYLRQADLRFEVTIPHFEEEFRKLEQHEITPLRHIQQTPASFDAGPVAIVD